MNLSSTIVLHAGFVTKLRDKITMKINQDTGEISEPEVKAGEEQVEMESNPIKNKSGKYIQKVGTQFCVRGNGVDKNFGCYPSREMAEAEVNGKSFIETEINGAGGMPRTGWQYGRRTTPVGYISQKTLSGFPGGSKGTGTKTPNPSMRNGKGVNHRFPNPSVHAGGPGSGRHKEILENAGYKNVGGTAFHNNLSYGKNHDGLRYNDRIDIKDSGHWTRYIKNDKFASGKNSESLEKHLGGKTLAATEWGEPNAGAYQHAHLDSNLFFHPPSLRNPKRVPTDDPGEKDDSLLDVTKRKQAHKDRMKQLKRGMPGGDPPLIPAHTTGIAPHQAIGMGQGMFASKIKLKPRRDLDNKVIRHAYGAAKI